MGICCCASNNKDEYEDVSIDDLPAFGASLGSIYAPAISNRVPSYSFTYTAHNEYPPTWRFQGTRGEQFNGTLASNVCVYGPTFESIPNLTPRQLKKYGLQDLKMNTFYESPINIPFRRQPSKPTQRSSSPPHYEQANERSSEAYTSPSQSPQVCNLRSSRRANRPNRQNSSNSPSKHKSAKHRSYSADSYSSPMISHYEYHHHSNSKQRSLSADHYNTIPNSSDMHLHPTNHFSISTLQSNGPPPSFVTINVTSISPQPPTIQINQNVHKSTQKTTQYNCIPPKENALPPRLPVDNLESPKPPPEPAKTTKPLVPIKVNSCSPHCLSSTSSSPVRSQTKAVVRPKQSEIPSPSVKPIVEEPSPEREPPPAPPPTINIQENQIDLRNTQTPSPRVLNRPSQIEIPKLKLSLAQQPKSPLSSPKRRPMSPTSPKRNLNLNIQSPRSRQSSSNSQQSSHSSKSNNSRSPRARQSSSNPQSPRSRQVSTNSQSPRTRGISNNSQSPRRTPKQRPTETMTSPRTKKNKNKVTILSPSGKLEEDGDTDKKNRQTRFNLKAPAPLVHPSEVSNADDNLNQTAEANPPHTQYIGSPKALVSRSSFNRKKDESPDLPTRLLSLNGNNLSFDLRDLGATYISTDGENDDEASISKSDES